MDRNFAQTRGDRLSYKKRSIHPIYPGLICIVMSYIHSYQELERDFFLCEWLDASANRTDRRVPLPASLWSSSLAPIRSARSLMPSKPKCPLGAKSVGLFGTVNPTPSSVTSNRTSFSKLMDNTACLAFA